MLITDASIVEFAWLHLGSYKTEAIERPSLPRDEILTLLREMRDQLQQEIASGFAANQAGIAANQDGIKKLDTNLSFLAKDIIASVETTAGHVKQAIDRLSSQLMGKLAANEELLRMAESKNEHALLAIPSQISALKEEQASLRSGGADYLRLSKQINGLAEQLQQSKVSADELKKLSSSHDVLLDKLQVLALSQSKDAAQHKQETEQILKELDDSKQRLEVLSGQLSDTEQSITSSIIKHSQDMVAHGYPCIFNIVKRELKGLKVLKSAFSRAYYVYCCCEFQCASSPATKDVLSPYWHPVTGTLAKPHFRRTIWQTKELVKTLAPVLKLSYIALKIASSMYGIPIPDLGKLIPDELSKLVGVDVSALASEFSAFADTMGVELDISEAFQDKPGDAIIEVLKDNGVSPVLMRPAKLSGDMFQALQALFPIAVRTSLILSA